MRALFSFLLICLAARGASATEPLVTRLERTVDAAAEAALRDGRFSGVILVAKDGKTLLRKAYGLADRERGIAHTPGTPFMIMSVSKQFTAALILRLAAQGRLSVHDKVSDYLPDWPLRWDDVTIHHLLSHSAGTEIDMTYFWLIEHHPEYWPEPIDARPPYEPRDLIHAPGTTFLYSNVGYTLLSRIASAAGGRPFDDLMRDEVFCPLGMVNTRPERGVRTPGRARGDSRTLALKEQGTIDIVGAGDLVSTVDDVAKWDQALNDDRFLPAPLRSAMLTPYVTGKYGEVGYGWFFRNLSDGRRLRFHAGHGAGFRAWNHHQPDLGLTVVILSNIEDAEAAWVRPLVDAVIKEVAG